MSIFKDSTRFADCKYLWNESTNQQAEKLDLWPMTLKFNMVLEVVKVHVRAKFHQAKCSGSWVIVRREKKTKTKTVLSTTAANSNNYLLWDGTVKTQSS